MIELRKLTEESVGLHPRGQAHKHGAQVSPSPIGYVFSAGERRRSAGVLACEFRQRLAARTQRGGTPRELAAGTAALR